MDEQSLVIICHGLKVRGRTHLNNGPLQQAGAHGRPGSKLATCLHRMFVFEMIVIETPKELRRCLIKVIDEDGRKKLNLIKLIKIPEMNDEDDKDSRVDEDDNGKMMAIETRRMKEMIDKRDEL